jgi:trehalose 6-phosphate phosphatase
MSPEKPWGTAARLVIEAVGPAPAHAAVFADFDGTLAEIVDDPEMAVAVPGAVESLDRLADRLGVVAVISGRPGTFLASRLELAERQPGLRVFGHYGLEEVLPGGTVIKRDAPAEYRDAFDAAYAMARAAAPRARVEHKGESVAFHFRERPEDEVILFETARQAGARFGLEIRSGRMVFELVAPASPDKGVVVGRLLDNLDCAVAFGDDLGDVAAFAALDSAAATSGLTAVKVAVGGSEAPRELTGVADVVLDSPFAVAAVLATLADTLDGSPPRA